MKKRLLSMVVLVGFVLSSLMVTGAFAAKDEIVLIAVLATKITKVGDVPLDIE